MRMEAAPAVQRADDPRPWWETRLCLALVVLATALPLAYPPIPPLVDLPGHIGRFRVELDLKHSLWLQQYYDFHWAAIGNLGVDLLVRVLAPIMGLEPAVKLIVLAIPPLTAAGFLWVAREVHARMPPTAFFALPFIYSFPFLFGFANFALSVALAFLAFGLWLRLGRMERTTLRSGLFVPISLIIFFAHAYGWCLLGLLCFCAEAVRLRDCGRSWLRAGIGAGLATLVMALPLLFMLIWRRGSDAGAPADWFDWEMKWRWIYGSLRDRWGYFDMSSIAFTGLIFLYALISRRFTLSRVLALSAITLAISFILLPGFIFTSAYADMRLVPYLFAVALLAIGFRDPGDSGGGQFLAVLAVAFLVVRLATTTVSLAIAANDQQAKLGALGHVPEGARVASFYLLPCAEPWALHRNSHLGGLVIARREGFSNDQWIRGGQNLLELKYRDPGPFASDPSEVVRPNGCHVGGYRTLGEALAWVPKDKFDYIWLINVSPLDEPLVRGLQRVWRGPATILYRTNTAAPRVNSL